MKFRVLAAAAMAMLLCIALGPARADILPGQGDVFTLVFDENGNAQYNLRDGTGFHPLTGSLQPDPSNGGALALTYFLPQTPVGNGDVTINDPSGAALSVRTLLKAGAEGRVLMQRACDAAGPRRLRSGRHCRRAVAAGGDVVQWPTSAAAGTGR